MSTDTESDQPRRGRPRDREARTKILQAARSLLAKGGLTAVTMEGIAAAAGVSKPTIYRYWPNAHAVAMTAMIESQAADPEPLSPSDRTAVEDLKRQLRHVVHVFTAGAGRGALLLVAASDADSELSKSFRHNVILRSREEGRTILQRAIKGGELRADLNLEVALDQIYGPVFFRLLLGHAPLDEDFADTAVDQTISGFAST